MTTAAINELTSATVSQMEKENGSENENEKPVILLTSEEGIEAPGLRCLLNALQQAEQQQPQPQPQPRFDVNVCAPESDKSGSGHGVTLGQTVTATSVDISAGVTAYQVSGTPVDCISLSLSGALFSGKKPSLVISGINKGSNCGNGMLYSGTVAGAREALMMGIPSIAISLNWKEPESNEDDFKAAAKVCLPLICATVQDILTNSFPKDCALVVNIPTHPSDNKGFKVTRQSTLHWHPTWKPVSSPKPFMSRQHGYGIQIAQLGLAASAMGAARHLRSQRKVIEVESVGEAANSDPPGVRVKKFCCVELSKPENDAVDNDIDYTALQEGFVTITPVGLGINVLQGTHASVANWINTMGS